jgi:hypothetical protein
MVAKSTIMDLLFSFFTFFLTLSLQNDHKMLA